MKRLGKIAIIGVGLIGGSIGITVKRNRLAREVIGIGRRRSSINRAVKLKAIDKGTLNPVRGVAGADIIILATPVLIMPALVRKIMPAIKDGCVVTDVGSAKSAVTRSIEQILPKTAKFVGSHPMAGSEKRGVAYAKRGLFNGSLCVLTTTKKTDKRALNLVKGLWKALGAKTVVMPARTHDKIASEISHLPHMAAFSIMESVDRKNVKFASSGFADFTRIASSDADVWKDIAISNRGEILKSMSRFRKNLAALERAIKRKDKEALLKIFKSAKAKRKNLK